MLLYALSFQNLTWIYCCDNTESGSNRGVIVRTEIFLSWQGMSYLIKFFLRCVSDQMVAGIELEVGQEGEEFDCGYSGGLRIGADEPLSVETSRLPARLFPKLLQCDLTSLYGCLKENYHVQPRFSDETLEIIPCPQRFIKPLKLADRGFIYVNMVMCVTPKQTAKCWL